MMVGKRREVLKNVFGLFSKIRTAATGVVVLFAPWREDQVKTRLQLPGVWIFLSYRRSQRK